MAYVVKNGQGTSGYSRTDFITALEGKQPKLVSGQNIKTINQQPVLGSGNIVISPQSYEYNLSDLEVTLKNKAISDVNYIRSLIVNSEANTSNATAGDLFMFAVISDLHHVHPEDNYAAENASVSAEHTIRLLGATAYDIGFDAVVCCGDLSSGDFSKSKYTGMIEEIVGMFNEYIPCPYFFVDGNHDRGYNSLKQSNSDWMSILQQSNNDRGKSNITITKVQDIINQGLVTYKDGDALNDGETSASYFIDFNDKKVRFAMMSTFECGQSGSSLRWAFWPISLYAMTKFLTPKNASEWMLAAFAHHSDAGGWNGSYSVVNNRDTLLRNFMVGKNLYRTASLPSSYAGHEFDAPNGVDVKGKSLLGFIYGHTHMFAAKDTISENVLEPSVNVSNSFVKRSSLTNGYPTQEKNYSFSIFIIDNINWWMYEIKVGGDFTKFVDSYQNNYESLSSGRCERVARANETTDDFTGIWRYKLTHS